MFIICYVLLLFLFDIGCATKIKMYRYMDIRKYIQCKVLNIEHHRN